MRKVVPTEAVLIPDNAELVFEGVIYDVYQWPQKLYDGTTTTFEMLRRPDTVDILGIVGNDILVTHDEQPNRGTVVGLPGGRAEGEDILKAAQREMLEETGYEFRHWRLLKVWQASSQIESFIHLYLAWEGRRAQEQQLDPGERITAERVSLDSLKTILRSEGAYLTRIREVVEPLSGIQDLLTMPPFQGKEIER